MEYPKFVQFKNWTKTDFSQKRDNVEFVFSAGGIYNVPADVAKFFANKLAVRELYASKDPKDEMLPALKVKEFMNRCFPGSSLDELENSSGMTSTFDRVDIVAGKGEETKVDEPVKVPEKETTQIVNDQAKVKIEDDDEDEEEKANNRKPAKFKAGRKPKTIDGDYVK
jgi:hypothetical protein